MSREQHAHVRHRATQEGTYRCVESQTTRKSDLKSQRAWYEPASTTPMQHAVRSSTTNTITSGCVRLTWWGPSSTTSCAVKARLLERRQAVSEGRDQLFELRPEETGDG